MGNLGFSQVINQDDYWGGLAVTNNVEIAPRDVVGRANVFDLTHTEFSVEGDVATLNIYGNYFNHILNNSSDLLDTSMGDLFISVDGLSWTEGGEATKYDYFGGATHSTWEYAVVLGQYDNSTGALSGGAVQDGGVYSASNTDEYVFSDPGSRTTFRANQEVRLETQSRMLGGASWYIDESGDFLSISIQDFPDVFGDVNLADLAFHWTMSCGNDVIEVNPVPEPSTIGLLGAAGLMGVLYVRRRIVRRKK